MDPEVTREWPSPESYKNFSELSGKSVWKTTITRKDGTEQDVLLRIIKLQINDMSLPTGKVMESLNSLRLSHKGILKVYHAFWNTTTDLWVVQDISGFDRKYNYLDKLLPFFPEGLPENLIGAIIKKLLKILDFIHKSHKVWYDVRGTNVLFKPDGTIVVNLQSLRSIFHMKTRDSLPFMAPEILSTDAQPEHSLKCKADIWSCGVTAIQMATGKVPYEGLTVPQIREKIISRQLPPFKETFSDAFKSFLFSCFQVNPADRASASQLLNHEFLHNLPKSKGLIQSLLLSRVSDLEGQAQKMEHATDSVSSALPSLASHMTLPETLPKNQHNNSPLNGPLNPLRTIPISLEDEQTQVHPGANQDDHGQNPNSLSIPLDTNLAETSSHYFLLLRVLPGTSISISLKPHSVVVKGKLPLFQIEPDLKILSGFQSEFERKILFPENVSGSYEVFQSNDTLTLKIKKFGLIEIGNYTINSL
uniref:Protein kinase domain-containing protein n=1 Tax=Arcella intermedia TaxID=1963864 RepID=A0A6B2L301_9EUKA